MDLQRNYKSYRYSKIIYKFELKLYFPLLIFLVVFSIFSCEQLPFKDPLSGPFPYEFQYEKIINGNSLIVDLDNDGKEEFINFDWDSSAENSSYIHIRDSDCGLIDRENFHGRIKKIFAVQWNEDENKEILIPYCRNDSLFLRILDNDVNTLIKEAFLFSGKTKVSERGEYKWEGSVLQIESVDLELDGNKELIVLANESRALNPRGVYVFDNKTLKLKWKHEIGPRLSYHPIIYDWDKDGNKEIMLPTSAPCNGNQVKDTDDEHSYLILLNHLGKRKWKREIGGRFSAALLKMEDINGDGAQEVVSFFTEWNKANIQPQIEIIDPLNDGLPFFKPRKLPLSHSIFSIVQTDRNIGKEFLVADKTGQILLLNNQFEILRSKKLNSYCGGIFTCEDLNNDGYEEIFMSISKGTIWLDHNLSILAKTPMMLASYHGELQLYHRDADSPLLHFLDYKTGKLFSIKKIPNYLILYYGPRIGILLGLLFIAGLIFLSLNLRKKRNYWNKAFENFAAVYPHPVFIIDDNFRLTYSNLNGAVLLNSDNMKLPVPLVSLMDKSSSIINQLSFLKNAKAVHQEREFTDVNKSNKIMHLIAEPLFSFSNIRLHWLIIFYDAAGKQEIDTSKAWAAMAQRIAHDIKNPLTSILLSLQRLQLEYQDRDKKNIDKYNQYTNRIIERIEFLRRQSRDFMKFVNLEKINLQPTDLNKVIENIFIDAIIEIPTDIILEKKLSPEIPITHLDQEQIQTIVENLFTNAINAMPDGGKITISTSLAFDLQLPNGSKKVSDYIVLEVMDTGIGIPDKLKEKLFQPFITNTHLGTGLGLTIVKKIIDDHDGFIEVNSEEDVGTSFIIYLPVA